MDVVVVGGGPNGLMLACELALGGVRPVVLERLLEPGAEPRSNGLVGQVVRMVDRRGLFERLSGQPGPPLPNDRHFMFAAMPLDLGLLADSPIYNLPVPEAATSSPGSSRTPTASRSPSTAPTARTSCAPGTSSAPTARTARSARPPASASPASPTTGPPPAPRTSPCRRTGWTPRPAR